MKPTLLIVDDNEEILDFLEHILSPTYTTLTACNGQAALKLVETEAIHLIICDVMMPVMDGFTFCANIKSSAEYGHIPTILLTARDTMQAKVQGLELGADAYMEKPFSKEHLMAQIKSLLNNRYKIKEYFANSPLVNIKFIAHSKSDELFMENLNETIHKNLEDTDLDVEKLARILNMSRITLYRKIKAISVLTPFQLINITRLKRAAELLAQGDYRIYEVSDMVGFSSQSNFTRNFQKQFNTTPSEYIQSKGVSA